MIVGEYRMIQNKLCTNV